MCVCVYVSPFKSAQTARFNTYVLLLDDRNMSSVVLVPHRWAPRNRVEQLRLADMQQEGVVSVLIPHPAPRCRAFMLPCVEAPMGESTVLSAAAGGWSPQAPLELMCCGARGAVVGPRVKE